jgi:hypothetical protein
MTRVSSLPDAEPPIGNAGEPFDYDDAPTDDCPQCFGAGGYAVCQEDCCPNVFGEEDCDDPACWRRCSVCRGKGYVGGGA